jgi:hypothetical protein
LVALNCGAIELRPDTIRILRRFTSEPNFAALGLRELLADVNCEL